MIAHHRSFPGVGLIDRFRDRSIDRSIRSFVRDAMRRAMRCDAISISIVVVTSMKSLVVVVVVVDRREAPRDVARDRRRSRATKRGRGACARDFYESMTRRASPSLVVFPRGRERAMECFDFLCVFTPPM